MDKNSSTRCSHQFSSFCTCLRLLSVGFKVIMLFLVSCVYVQLFFPAVQILYWNGWTLGNFSFSNIPDHNQFSSMTLWPCVQPGPQPKLALASTLILSGVGHFGYLFWSSDFSQGLKNPSWRISLNSCPEICWISYTNWFTSTSFNHSFT